MNSTTTLVLKSMIGAAIAIIAIGCGNPDSGDPAYKTGDLGKGGFLFGCADGVACREIAGASTTDTAKFPKGIASGSTFGVRFVANQDMGNGLVLDFESWDTEYKGTRVEGLEPFITTAPGRGLTAVRPGLGTLVARTFDGTVIDQTTMTIAKTASLLVYDADDDRATAVKTLSFSLENDTSKRVRIVGLSAGGDKLAGSISHAWTFEPTGIVTFESKDDGVSTFVAEKEGTTTATVKGAGVEQTVTIEVKP